MEVINRFPPVCHVSSSSVCLVASTSNNSRLIRNIPAHCISAYAYLVCAILNVSDELLHLGINVSNKRTLAARLSCRDCRSGDLETTILVLSINLKTIKALVASIRKRVSASAFLAETNAAVTAYVYWDNCDTALPIDNGLFKHFQNEDLIVKLFNYWTNIKLFQNALKGS